MTSAAFSRKVIATLWFIGALLLFSILIVQSLFGKYGSRTEEAWGWFLPTVMPTLSLIVGVLVSEATGRNRSSKSGEVATFMFLLAIGLSALYLMLVVLVLLLQPFTGLSPIEVMKRSNLWLGPLQGLVSAVLGVFFLRGERGVKHQERVSPGTRSCPSP
jgi:hypothetical protein